MSHHIALRAATIGATLFCLVSAPAALAQLEEIVVTAQKREQSLQDVPLSVGVLNGDALERAQFSDFRELAKLSPSISFQDGFAPVATNFIVRGVGSYAFTGGIQPSVGVIVDGVPMARAGEFIVDLADVERIEVLRGPQGTLFGRNSTGGAINVIRNRPTDEFEASVDLSLTDDDEVMTRGMISGSIADGVRGRLVGMFSERDGHIENLGPAGGKLGGLDQVALLAKLEFDIGDKGSVMLSADYSDREHGFSPQTAAIGEVLRPLGDVTGETRARALGGGDLVAGRAIIANPFQTAVSKVGNKNENESSGFSATINYDFSDSISFKSITAWRDFTDYNNPDVDETPAEPDNLFDPFMLIISTATSLSPNYSGSGVHTHSRGVEADYLSQEFVLEISNERVDWTLGGFYQDYEENIQNQVALLIFDSFNPAFGCGANFGGTAACGDEYVLSSNNLDNTYSVQSIAVFADATFHVTDRLDLFGGLRWTSEELDGTLNNFSQLAPFTFAEVGTRFDSTNRALFTDDLPLFPNGGDPTAVGTDSTEEDFVSFRAGASFAFTETVNGYASISRGQIGVGKNISFTGRTGSFLKPTTADSYEIGLKSQLVDNRLRLNIAVFTQEVTDLQSSALIPGTVSAQTINAGDLDISGIEADLLFAINDNWTFSAAVVTLDSKIRNLLQLCYIDQLTAGTGCDIDQDGDGSFETQDVSGKPGANAPDLKYNVGLAANFPTQNLPFDFFGNLNYVWQDDIQFTLDQDDLSSQDAYGVLDLTLGIVDKDGRYELQVYGKNITDEFYVADSFEAFGALGRQVIRVPRSAQAYWGARLKVNFN
jgi:iron complex outermembrane receptor protein